jgi:copper chaperone CopZ
MKYQINIKGMHCQGCSNLIKLTLEDAGFTDVSVDKATDKGSFRIDSQADQKQVEVELNKAFTGLSGYTYENLQEI